MNNMHNKIEKVQICQIGKKSPNMQMHELTSPGYDQMYCQHYTPA